MMRNHRAIFVICLVLNSASAGAFRSLKTESFTDPDYRGLVFRKSLLLVQNASNDSRMQIEERLVDDLKGRGVEVIPNRRLFPPTRNWTPDEMNAALVRENVTVVLIVTVGASAASVIPVATQTFGRTTVNGNVYASGNAATFNSSASSQSTSFNIVHASSTAEFSVVLIDVSTGRTAWYADITSKAAGQVSNG